MNDISGGYPELPRSSYFNNSVRRARTAAEQRSHRYVTLEHLLYALLDDPDAQRLLEGVNADIAGIRAAASEAINHRMSSLVVPNGRPPSFSYKFDSLMVSATNDAMRLGRREIDGALALIAIARDPENNAAALLTANGFGVEAALNYLVASRSAAPKSASPPVAPPREQVTALLKKADPPSIRSALDGEVDDVIATVRHLLDAGEQRALASQAPGMPNANPAQNRMPLPQRPPTLMPPVSQAKRMEQPMAPAISNQLVPSHAGAKADVRANRKDRKEPEAGKQARRAREGAGSIAHLFDGIPRAMTVGAAETVEIQLSKDEAMALLAGGKPQEASKSAPTRAITIKLAAPEGGFFIETLSPETQWLFDRPAFLGEEAFGRWVYAILPQERGRHVLTLEVHVRDIDVTGVARDTPIPAQAVEIRVRRGFRRAFANIFRALLLLAAGGAITEGGLYLLKILGKIPQMPWQ